MSLVQRQLTEILCA